MSITFVTKYPTALKNATWQSKKSFKDKTKNKTKTGLAEALKKAETDWNKIEFKKLIAAKQSLGGKSLAQKRAVMGEAHQYLVGRVVQDAINSLDAAATKARTTGANTSLSGTASRFATTLSGQLTAQAKLLRDIELDDFQESISGQAKQVRDWEAEHTRLIRKTDQMRDDLQDEPTLANWQASQFRGVLERGAVITKSLAGQTEDQHWREMDQKWNGLLEAFRTSDGLIKANQGRDAEAEIGRFINHVQDEFGGVFM
jgi:hypothetical protein